MSRLAAAAEYYAQLGYSVFPLTPRSKIPLIRGGKGCLDATTDLAQIQRWWRNAPEANIGLRCGAVSNCFAVDIDVHPKKRGDEHWAELCATHGGYPETPEHLTPTGGKHIVFRWVPELDRAIWDALTTGVDLRGTNQYIAAAPSIHPDTRTEYTWDAGRRIDDTALAVPPSWLIGLILGRPGVRKHSRGKSRHTRPVDPMTFELGRVFHEAGLLGRQHKPGVFLVQCPQEALHTTGRRFDSSTAVVAPAPGSRDDGTFSCFHESCRGVIS